MATFNYTAKQIASGKLTKGIVSAPDRAQALDALKRDGLVALTFKEKGGGFKKSLVIFHRVTLMDKMNFTKQLAVMVKAGLPLVDSLEIQASQMANAYFQKIITDIKESVRSGAGLSKSMEKYKKNFGDVYVAMVGAGEKSGQLDKVLERLGESLEKEYELVGKIKGAFYYPAFIMVVLIAVVIFILIFVIPQLKVIFEENNVALPFVTKALLALSAFFVNFWYLAAIAAVGSVVGLKYAMKLKPVRQGWDRAQLKLPIFGNFLQKIYLERFARTLASLVATGIPILEVLTTTTLVVTNSIYQKELLNMREMVERGQSVADSMRAQKHFPIMVANLLAIGERTGNLAPVSEDLANFYAREIDQTAKNMSSLIEPVIMVIMGLGVAFVVIAVIMPIYKLTGAVE